MPRCPHSETNAGTGTGCTSEVIPRRERTTPTCGRTWRTTETVTDLGRRSTANGVVKPQTESELGPPKLLKGDFNLATQVFHSLCNMNENIIVICDTVACGQTKKLERTLAGFVYYQSSGVAFLSPCRMGKPGNLSHLSPKKRHPF